MSTDKTDMPRLSDKKVDAVTKGDRDVCHYDLAADLLDVRRELAETTKEWYRFMFGRACPNCGYHVTMHADEPHPMKAELEAERAKVAELEDELRGVADACGESSFLMGCAFDESTPLGEEVLALAIHDNAIDAAEADLEAIDRVLDGSDYTEFRRAERVLATRRRAEAAERALAALRGREAEAAEALRRWGAWCWSPEGLGEPLYDAAVDGMPAWAFPDPKPSTGGDL